MRNVYIYATDLFVMWSRTITTRVTQLYIHPFSSVPWPGSLLIHPSLFLFKFRGVSLGPRPPLWIYSPYMQLQPHHRVSLIMQWTGFLTGMCMGLGCILERHIVKQKLIQISSYIG